MEFRIAAEELKRALYRAQGIVERKTTMPILSNVLVNATKAGVQITAFDLDVGIVSEHPAEVTKPGSLTLSRQRPSSTSSRNLPEPHLTVRKLPNQYARAPERQRALQDRGDVPRGVPEAPQGGEREPGVGSRPGSAGDDPKTAFAISTDETRYILNGVFFEPREGGKVRMVATDGHRLALVERVLAGDFKLKGGVIIPRKGLHELRRLLDEAPDVECALGFAENSALFRKPGLTMVMRLIDGQFPEYQRVIPKEGERKVQIPGCASPRRSSGSLSSAWTSPTR
jgi:DNA polymerase-3 subunit beta